MNGFKLYPVAPGKFALHAPNGAKLRIQLARIMFEYMANQLTLSEV